MRLLRLLRGDRAERPYVAFVATGERSARRLYRSQNLVWIWLGIAAVLSCVGYFLRPDLGPVLVTRHRELDALREVLFAVGGALIVGGVWWIRRVLEVSGHILFSTGAVITAAAQVTLPGPGGVSVATTLGVAFASAFRVYFIVRWIGATDAGGD